MKSLANRMSAGKDRATVLCFTQSLAFVVRGVGITFQVTAATGDVQRGWKNLEHRRDSSII
jgi:hypothetical protein